MSLLLIQENMRMMGLPRRPSHEPRKRSCVRSCCRNIALESRARRRVGPLRGAGMLVVWRESSRLRDCARWTVGLLSSLPFHHRS